MRLTPVLAGAVALVMTITAEAPAQSLAPCSIAPVVVDSARDEVLTVLTSGGQIVQEMKQEMKINKLEDLKPMQLVRDAATCIRLAPTFGRKLEPGTRFVVLRLGPLYYARDPDQRQATGVITDTTFRVLARLGVAIP
jgi:hypothetical protein